MATGTDDIKMNNLSRRVNSVEEANIAVANMVRELEMSVSQMQNSMETFDSDLKRLMEAVSTLIRDQRKSAALGQASTELVRVRQELEQKFGNYRIVRETMLGVLQATDLALVRKNTISRVSEEIMLSTPEYWLAPCLVAVSAWIGNDRDLAERAIAEAVRRDEEKTALTMALICRRNNRIQTCYEWLSIYFAKQDAANFSEGTFAYIDAYVNGIFGPDEKHMCDDYINKWMNEIRGNSSAFESDQEAMWKKYCERFSMDVSSRYPALRDNTPEYPQISSYLGRIGSVDAIAEKFSDINNAYIDAETLKTRIDKNLVSLISRYDGKEEPLRKEERYLLMIKECDGDAVRARDIVAREEEARKEKTLNLVEQMTRAIVTEEDVAPSQKKTALSFLSSYINRGFNSYISEKKTDFPDKITITLDGWSGITSKCENIPALTRSYEDYMLRECSKKTAEARPHVKAYMSGGIALAVLALVMLFVALPLAAVSLVAGGCCFILMAIAKNKAADEVKAVEEDYRERIAAGKHTISETADQWLSARNEAERFESENISEITA